MSELPWLGAPVTEPCTRREEAGIFCSCLRKLQDVGHLVAPEIQQWTKQERCPLVVEEKRFRLFMWLPLISEAAPEAVV